MMRTTPDRLGNFRGTIRKRRHWIVISLILIAAGVAQWHDLEVITALLIVIAAFYVYANGM